MAGASETLDYTPFAVALDRARKETGVNFIGGFSALVQTAKAVLGGGLIRQVLDGPAHEGHRVHVDARLGGAHVHAVRA